MCAACADAITRNMLQSLGCVNKNLLLLYSNGPASSYTALETASSAGERWCEVCGVGHQNGDGDVRAKV